MKVAVVRLADQFGVKKLKKETMYNYQSIQEAY